MHQLVAPVAVADPELRPAVHLALDGLCRARLQWTLCPRRYHAVRSMPVTAAGKVDRRALSRLVFTNLHNHDGMGFDSSALVPLSEHFHTALGPGGAGSVASPDSGDLGSMESKVASVWRRALGLPSHVQLRRSDGFIRCGGDSLAALGTYLANTYTVAD